MAARKNFLYLGGGGDQRVTPITNDPAFEFEESDLWNSNDAVFPPQEQPTKKSILPNSKWASRKPLIKNRGDHQKQKPMAGTSLPVNVPDWSKILRDEYKNGRRENDDEMDSYEDDDEDEDRLPPHEYLARTRIASFSVHEGIGRTLKGRDLSRVRNAIWKQTGFED